jgi:uncharacterized protein YecT (DUF1311 family)
MNALRRILATATSLVAIQCLPAPGAAQDQTEMNRQAGAALQEADRRLNASYAKLRARLSPPSRAKLQAAEEAWIRFRDLECAFIGSPTTGGSIHSMIVAQCLTGLTERRIKDIEAQLNCQEGDLSCVRN